MKSSKRVVMASKNIKGIHSSSPTYWRHRQVNEAFSILNALTKCAMTWRTQEGHPTKLDEGREVRKV